MAQALHTKRVAVLGSGIAGSTAARSLAEAGLKVTVVESGFGVGGRASTRITRDEAKLRFDHGAQYISKPKTASFQQAVTEWQEAGFVKNWQGKFAKISNDQEATFESDDKPHYVGYPAMNSISSNILEHDNIELILQTRACATFDESTNLWSLTSHTDQTDLGAFDWLVASDRLSATNNRADFRNAPVSHFKDKVASIESVPILTLLITFEKPLKLPFDGARFEEAGAFGSLGWIARDSSKPGRERSDGQECWVVQSDLESARRALSEIKGSSFEDKRERVRERSEELLMKDFLEAIPKLSNDDTVVTPKVAYSVGHRWSAAFPGVAPSEEEYIKDLECKFVACGDYLGTHIGRIEGSYLSGKAAADTVLSSVREVEQS